MGKQKQLLRQELVGTTYRYVPKNLKRKIKSNKRKNKQIQQHNIFDDLFFWAREIRMKYEYKCVICGSKRYLEAHHLLYKSKYPKLKYSLNNGILLCHKCHDELHQLNDIVVVDNDQDKDTISINQ